MSQSIRQDYTASQDDNLPPNVRDSTNQSYFHGTGFQHSGDGPVYISGNVNIGAPSYPKPPSTHTPFCTVPFSRDPDFIDRPELLEWIRNKSTQPAGRAALVGLGGVGKSQVAIQFCYHVRDESPRTWVFWVHASTKTRFEEAYRGIADRLELPTRNDPRTNIFQLVYNWMCNKENGRWVLVLDNVDDAEVFFPKPLNTGRLSENDSTPLANYLPQCEHGFILVTSRNKDPATKLTMIQNIQEVTVMSDVQALQLLDKKLSGASDQTAATDLVRALEYIPLAITQAAAYIHKQGQMTVKSYLEKFHKKKFNLLSKDMGDIRRDATVSNSVLVTWQMSFERIRNTRPSAADLLSLMSNFNPQGIPEWILQKRTLATIPHDLESTSNLETDSQSDADSDANTEFDDDIEMLQDFSLIARTLDNMFEMHALVQLCTKLWLSSSNSRSSWETSFRTLVLTEFPAGQYENWVQCQQLIPHLEFMLYPTPRTDQSLEKWDYLLTNVAWYLWMRGNYDIAERIAVRAVTAHQNGLKDDSNSLYRSISMLALVLQYRGKYEEAEEMNRRALEGREKELGPQHPFTLTSVSNLALVLQHRGKYEEAEEMNRRALEGYEKELGPRHPDTLTSVYNLAYLYHQMARYDLSSGLYQRASSGFEDTLGTDHPTTTACFRHYSAMQEDMGASTNL